MVSAICVLFHAKDILIPDTECSVMNFFFLVSRAPVGSEPPYNQGFTVTPRHTAHSVGLLWTKDRLEAEILLDNTQHSQLIHVHATDGLEPAIPARDGQQSHNLDRLATEVGLMYIFIQQYS